MTRHRVYAELEPEPEGVAEAPPEPAVQEPPVTDESLAARMAALQRGAGNSATQRLLRATLAREPTAVDPWGAARGVYDQLNREAAALNVTIVPEMLQRLVPSGQIGTKESLGELTLMARQELERHLAKGRLPTDAPLPLSSTVADIQRIITTVAAQRQLMIPGHRRSDDAAGLANEAKALAALSGLKLPDLAIDASVGGFKFRFDGELAASGKVAGADVTAKGSAGGAEVEAKGGPVTGKAEVGKDGGKVHLEVKAGDAQLKGDLTAKAGEKTTYSVTLELKFAGGAVTVPDPAAMAALIQAAGDNVAAAGRYLGDVVAAKQEINKASVEEKLKPVSESIGKVSSYAERHKAAASSTPGATLGATVKGDGGGVTATITLTITF